MKKRVPSDYVKNVLSSVAAGTTGYKMKRGTKIYFYNSLTGVLHGEIICSMCKKPMDKIIEDAVKWCATQAFIGIPTRFEVV